MQLPVNKPLPTSVVNALGLIANGGNWRGVLQEAVLPVVLLNESAGGGTAGSQDEAAFIGYNDVGPVAGQYSLTQLWNPAGSGVVVYIDELHVAVTTASGVHLYRNTADLSADADDPGRLKDFGGAAASRAAKLRADSLAAIPGTAGQCARYLALALTDLRIRFEDPIILQEGNGLLIASSIQNNNVNVVAEWRERVA